MVPLAACRSVLCASRGGVSPARAARDPFRLDQGRRPRRSALAYTSPTPSVSGPPAFSTQIVPRHYCQMGFRLHPPAVSSWHKTLAERATHAVRVGPSLNGLFSACPDLESLASREGDGRALPYWAACGIALHLVGPNAEALNTDWRVELWQYFIDPSHFAKAVELTLNSDHFDRNVKHDLASPLVWCVLSTSGTRTSVRRVLTC